MYAKVFRQIYDGTLATVGCWEAMVTFQQFLILADRRGEVDMVPEVISRITTIPLEIIQKGIACLTEPDPMSRTPTNEGRRLVLIDPGRPWGWQITNYEKYAAIRSAEERREYKRQWAAESRATEQAVHKSPQVSTVDSVDEVDPSYSYSYSDKRSFVPPAEAGTPKKASQPKFSKRVPDCPVTQIYAMYNEICTNLSKAKKLTEARRKSIRARWKDHHDIEWWKGYFEYANNQGFLAGKNNSSWVADIDFLMRESKMVAIMEAKYEALGK